MCQPTPATAVVGMGGKDQEQKANKLTGTIPARANADDDEHTTTFLGLPAELRNNVYLNVFHPRHEDLLQDGTNPDNIPLNREPALLRTCRQIRTEATPVYLHETTFAANFSFHNSGLNSRLHWCLRMLGPEKVANIQRLGLRFYSKNYVEICSEVEERLGWTELCSADVALIDGELERKIYVKDVLKAYGLDGLGVRDDVVRVFYRKVREKNEWRRLKE